jgi:hypothetical protein
MKKTDLVVEILRTVPLPRLVAAVGAILDARHRRGTGATGEVAYDVNVAAFMATCSARQLRLLRTLALGLEMERFALH